MEYRDITLLLRSHTPLLVLETHEERRALDLIKNISIDIDMPVFKWSVTSGMQRLDLNLDERSDLKDPRKVLEHIKAADYKGVYMLLDIHPYLNDPHHVRLLKEVAMRFETNGSKLVLISHEVKIPAEIKKLSVDFSLRLPGDDELKTLVREEAIRFKQINAGKKVKTDNDTLDLLVRNLKGLTFNDARRLVHAAIVDDGAITESDLPEVMQAKYKLMNRDDVLSFEFETSNFSELAGMKKLKKWLLQREKFFHRSVSMSGMESPKGILLLGVQGCGKSVAAKAVAGIWNVPLLRLDFGRLYNKYVGETERNIREALTTAEVMSPCVLWIDELEKGISVNENDDGTSQRLLGTMLTWMAENKRPVFIVATSNNIEQLPPELIRKGRLDEVFFVDLPTVDVRQDIFHIHADKRELDKSILDMKKLAELTDGFSGSEIEQLVVSAVYSAHANDKAVSMDDLIEEIKATKPLSVLMAEKIQALRNWAEGRTVAVD